MPTPRSAKTELVATLEGLMAASVGLTVRALLENLSVDELTLTQWRVMAVIADHGSPMRVSDIAGRIGASVPSASRLIARLRGRALVAVTTVDADRRTSLISLTEAGRRAVLSVQRARHQMIREAIEGFERPQGSFEGQLFVIAEAIALYESQPLRLHAR